MKATASYELLSANGIAGKFFTALYFTDSVSVSDALTSLYAYSRVLGDSATAFDVLAYVHDVAVNDFGKSASDTASAIDVLTKEVIYDRPFTDSAAASDVLTKEVIYDRTFVDSITAYDVFEYVKGAEINNLGDASAASDVLTREVAFDRPFTDSAAASDVLTREVAFDRPFTDSAAASDGQTNDFGKEVLDQVSAYDILIAELGSGRAFAEAVTSPDSGVVLNQDYVNDPFYFASDYVGTIRTF